MKKNTNPNFFEINTKGYEAWSSPPSSTYIELSKYMVEEAMFITTYGEFWREVYVRVKLRGTCFEDEL